MAICMLDQHDVIAGAITLPLVGRPTAELRIDVFTDDTPPAPGDRVTLGLADEAQFAMTVVRAGDDGGHTRVVLVGGTGGLGKTIKPRFYSGIPAATVFKDAVTDAGEKPGSVDLPGSLPFWTRTEGSATTAIQALFLNLDGTRSWRVLPDGTVWAGKETWPDGPEVQVLDPRAGAGAYVLELAATVAPGMKLAEIGQVVRVVHTIGPQLRTEVWAGETA